MTLILNQPKAYNNKKNETLTVRLSKTTTQTITIPPTAIICEVQPVTVEDHHPLITEEGTELLEKVDFTKSVQLQEGKQHRSFQIFSGKAIMRVRHRIELHDEQPFKHRYSHQCMIK